MKHHETTTTMALEWTIMSAPVITIAAQAGIAKMRKRRKVK